MSLAWRFEYRGVLYHLLSCDNELSDIFIDEHDWNEFLITVEGMSERFEINVFTYVLIATSPSFTQNPTRQSNIGQIKPEGQVFILDILPKKQ
jgi:hypothetical protein